MDDMDADPFDIVWAQAVRCVVGCFQSGQCDLNNTLRTRSVPHVLAVPAFSRKTFRRWSACGIRTLPCAWAIFFQQARVLLDIIFAA